MSRTEKSFLRYILPDIFLFVVATITLPLWLPFWCRAEFRNWLDEQRFYWECEQRMDRNTKRTDEAVDSDVPLREDDGDNAWFHDPDMGDR